MALLTYRQNLTDLRSQQPNHRDLPDLAFSLVGMGNWRKLIYCNGTLKEARKSPGKVLENQRVDAVRKSN